ncbi:MAG: hypothetical protein Q9228_002526 [Teloschistes exilis]
MATSQPAREDLLLQILSTLQSIQNGYDQLAQVVQNVQVRLEGMVVQDPSHPWSSQHVHDSGIVENLWEKRQEEDESLARSPQNPQPLTTSWNTASPQQNSSSSLSSRIILTTYPGQSGIDPISMNWGHSDPVKRGPVVVSRSQNTIRRRNASRNLDKNHKPDFTNAQPAVGLGPFPQWGDAKKIVSIDPWGHVSPWVYASMIREENLHLRPTIAITRAHMKLPELEESVRAGRLHPDGKICLNNTGELAVTKFAVEPVWYLPGVAERFGIGKLRAIDLDAYQGFAQVELTDKEQMRVHFGVLSSRTREALSRSL